MNQSVTVNLLNFYAPRQLSVGKPWGGVVSTAPAGYRIPNVLNPPGLEVDQLSEAALSASNPFWRQVHGEFGDVIAIGLIPAFKSEGMMKFEESIQYGLIGRADAGGAQLQPLAKWNTEYFNGRLSKNQPRIATFLRPYHSCENEFIDMQSDRSWALPKSQTLPIRGNEKTIVERWPLGAAASLVHKQFDYKHDSNTVLRYLLFAIKEYLQNLYFDVDEGKIDTSLAPEFKVRETTTRLEKIVEGWGNTDCAFDTQFCIDLNAIKRHLQKWPEIST